MSVSPIHQLFDSHRPLPSSDWSAGQLVDWSGITYRLLGSLTRGGMAELFLATPNDMDTSRSPLVVFKRLRAGGTQERTVLEMFEHEGQVALRFDHPNVAAHFASDQAQGRPFLVMEYVEGQTLASLFAAAAALGARLDDTLVLHVAAQVARALHHAHETTDEEGSCLEIVHRDVCPRNILIGYDGAVKLIDFGIARSRLSVGQCEVGVVKGKPNYMAPEQATARPVDRRADVFSLGVVLWELCSGQRFSGNAAPPERRYRLPYAPVPRLTDLRPDIDPRIDAIVSRALELDPELRFPTADAMRVALVAAMEGECASREKLGQLMNELFAETRDAMRGEIATQLERASGINLVGTASAR